MRGRTVGRELIKGSPSSQNFFLGRNGLPGQILARLSFAGFHLSPFSPALATRAPPQDETVLSVRLGD